MKRRRGYRWILFLTALISIFYFIAFDSDSLWALGSFFVTGGLWYWLKRRKMRELDAPRPK